MDYQAEYENEMMLAERMKGAAKAALAAGNLETANHLADKAVEHLTSAAALAIVLLIEEEAKK